MNTLLKTPFFVGRKKLPSNVFCAPLAGCSDLPFRRMLAKYRPGLMYTEMVKMGALIHGNPQTKELLHFEEEMRPIGAQICGSSPEMAEECAKRIEEMGFDVIDLNCGCPVDKITKDGSGSGMLKNPSLIGEVLRRMVRAVSIPVTVKIRAGWDEKSIVAPLVTKIAEEAGAKAICIHGRTREQAYKGPAVWSYITECKEVAKEILVIGNGDIVDASSAEKIIRETGCDAILLSRGLLGSPWLIEDIYRHFTHEKPLSRTPAFSMGIFLEHFRHIISYKEPKKALLDLRRIGCWFLREIEGAAKIREKINQASSISELEEIVYGSISKECLEISP